MIFNYEWTWAHTDLTLYQMCRPSLQRKNVCNVCTVGYCNIQNRKITHAKAKQERYFVSHLCIHPILSSFQSSKLPELQDGVFLLILTRRSLSDMSSLPWLLVSTEMSDNVSLMSSLNTQETLAVNLFLPLSNVWLSMGHFSRNAHFHDFFLNNAHSKLYENLRNSLVTDIRSQIDEWTEK